MKPLSANVESILYITPSEKPAFL